MMFPHAIILGVFKKSDPLTIVTCDEAVNGWTPKLGGCNYVS
jgi:hypothetical protein